MKQALFTLLCSLGVVFASQAVTIHWDTEEDETTASFAMLVYYKTGELQFDENKQVTGTDSSNIYTQNPFDHTVAYEEGYNTEVGTARTDGTWYLVLLDSNGDNYKAASMAASQVSYYDGDISSPQVITTGGMGTLTMPTSWTATPEPCSVALLLLGAAAVATRRKKLI
ncbi:MAG: PEP-CTERM sorting domain-containing protein [Kiritimatiellae bacterium]|nr:PEP-CTERM sorting domain-containing protein [Kiritimatiellia bacterium]